MMKKLFLLILILCFATPCFAGDGIIFFDSFESTCGAAYGDCTYNEGENIDDGYFWGRDMMCGSCTAQLGGLEGSQYARCSTHNFTDTNSDSLPDQSSCYRTEVVSRAHWDNFRCAGAQNSCNGDRFCASPSGDYYGLCQDKEYWIGMAIKLPSNLERNYYTTTGTWYWPTINFQVGDSPAPPPLGTTDDTLYFGSADDEQTNGTTPYEWIANYRFDTRKIDWASQWGEEVGGTPTVDSTWQYLVINMILADDATGKFTAYINGVEFDGLTKSGAATISNDWGVYGAYIKFGFYLRGILWGEVEWDNFPKQLDFQFDSFRVADSSGSYALVCPPYLPAAPTFDTSCDAANCINAGEDNVDSTTAQTVEVDDTGFSLSPTDPQAAFSHRQTDWWLCADSACNTVITSSLNDTSNLETWQIAAEHMATATTYYVKARFVSWAGDIDRDGDGTTAATDADDVYDGPTTVMSFSTAPPPGGGKGGLVLDPSGSGSMTLDPSGTGSFTY